MDGVTREMKAKLGKGGCIDECGGEIWWLVTSMFADVTVMFAESEEDMWRVVSVFYGVCKCRQLMVNASKSKVMRLKGNRVKV